MYTILVFSDSHGHSQPMVDAVAEAEPDHILFLGDGWREADELGFIFPHIPLVRVPGNCDYQPGEQPERLVELYGRRIFLCHGHTQGVKLGLSRFLDRARRFRADIALYGHTHRGYCAMEGDMWVMNPGSINPYERSSYGIITIDGDKCTCRIVPYRG